MNESFSCSVVIAEPPAKIWRVLTDSHAISQWMSEIDMNLQVIADWTENSIVIMRGDFHGPFENKGVVLRNDPERNLKYTHLSLYPD